VRPTVIREWYWWRQCRPSWRVVSWGKIEVAQLKGEYKIELPLVIEYKSGDDRYGTDMHYQDAVVRIYHTGRGKERLPYKLYMENRSGEADLKSGEVKQVNYVFGWQCLAKPLLGKTAPCKMTNHIKGMIHTGQVGIIGKYKGIGKAKFNAEVDWEIGE